MPEFPEADRPIPGDGSPQGPTSARLPGRTGSGQHEAPHSPYGPPSQETQNPYGSPANQPYGGTPVGSGPQTTSGGAGSGSRRTLATAGSAALLAAALASAGTYGVIKANGGAGDGAIETGNKTVINANPKDFADAGTINWSATAAKVNPSVVAITVADSSGNGDKGSGVILDHQGNIVTNNHVVAAGGSGGQVKVTLTNNRTYSANIVGTDPGTDLAVIRIKNVNGLQPVTMGDDSKLVVGQPVMAVGNPLGLAGTVTTGIVSALNRPVKTAGEGSDSSSGTSDDTVFTNAIQTSAAINPGNSGGALVDGSGRLIGINSSIASLSSGESGGQSGNIGIGFAIPAVVVNNIAGQLISKGKAEHALLGIATKDDAVSNDGAELTAAKVASVEKGGAADKAGIKTGDEVISIDGEPVTSSDALVGAVRARKVGSTVKLTILRNNEKKDVEVKLGSKESK